MEKRVAWKVRYMYSWDEIDVDD